MNTTLTTDPYSIESLLAKGLTAAEAKSLSTWVEKGKAGIAASKAPGFLAIYLMGLTVAEIAAAYPEIPLEILLYESVRGNWRELKQQYRDKMVAGVSGVVLDAKLDATTLLAQMLQATSQDWRAQILRYLANPKVEKRPDFLPDSPAQFERLINSLRGLTEADGKDKPPPVPVGHVNIQVNAAAGSTVGVGVTPSDVKAALMADMDQSKSVV